MISTSKIYIAGHKGLVGSSIQRNLTVKGFENLIVRQSKELDLRRQQDVEAFFEKERPEYVFLAAAKVGGIFANSTYKAEFIYDNITIAANVIHASYKTGVKKLLNLGSSCIYPKLAPQPLKEEYLLSGVLEPTNEPYAIAKIAAIKLCRYFNEQYGTNYISVMPTNLYGPHDNFDLHNSHVLPAFLRKLHLSKLLRQNDHNLIVKDLELFGNKPDSYNGSLSDVHLESLSHHLSEFGIYPDKITLWGSGRPFREFLYVDDMAEAALFIMEHGNAHDIKEFVNIGSGEDIPLYELAEMVKAAVGFKGEITWDTNKPDGTPRKLLDVSTINDLGWKFRVGLKEGIKRTYKWYLECYLRKK
jgi:GDP-L-fucose synthase